MFHFMLNLFQAFVCNWHEFPAFGSGSKNSKTCMNINFNFVQNATAFFLMLCEFYYHPFNYQPIFIAIGYLLTDAVNFVDVCFILIFKAYKFYWYIRHMFIS